MGKEYKIKFKVPADYNPENLFKRVPSPIHRGKMAEIYNFKIEEDGFYFLDSLVDNKVASVAFKHFVDEALSYCDSVEIIEL
ncbi:hypothetical protein EDC30_1264 [Paucimonas lemoignei]|uniref:Uncharacterized protein n=1 Tax=Paucimonas lemoignei TaxID=29443 RepID=A0A4V2UI33_PAULE|nr:hypothetical protein [Paucimonas lemoignei]TCS31966.1 hypothetical protein EDC30_1264 [Paucimonas lemoignei]